MDDNIVAPEDIPLEQPTLDSMSPKPSCSKQESTRPSPYLVPVVFEKHSPVSKLCDREEREGRCVTLLMVSEYK